MISYTRIILIYIMEADSILFWLFLNIVIVYIIKSQIK